MDYSSKSKCCKICCVEKNLDNFYKDSKSTDGYRSLCKICYNSKRKQTYAINNGKIDEKILLKQKFVEIKMSIDKKILTQDDPDELDKLNEELILLTRDYINKLRPETDMFYINFNDSNDNQEFESQKMLIQSRLSLFIAQKNHGIINTDNIIVNEINEKNVKKIKVQMPIKLQRKFIDEFIKSIEVTHE